MQHIINFPPRGEVGLVQGLRQRKADLILEKLFKSPRKTWQAHKGDLIYVIRYRPTWLLNRGFVRMLVSAFLNI